MSRASCAVVTLPGLDLRRQPDHRSEMRSQLLLGETVEILGASRSGQWSRVRNDADGYRGWVRDWGLVPCTRARAGRWQARARGRVDVSHAEVRAGRGSGALVSPLFWNNRLIVGPVRTGFRSAELPDGRRGFVAAAAISTRAGGPGLAERVRSLLGTPYLWGGRTPMGIDCSAFAQQLLGEHGVDLPRDAHEQFLAARPLARGEVPAVGDLLFFGIERRRVAHVGVSLGGGYFAHSRGRVRINAVDSDNPLYDKQLMDQFRGCRRPR